MHVCNPLTYKRFSRFPQPCSGRKCAVRHENLEAAKFVKRSHFRARWNGSARGIESECGLASPVLLLTFVRRSSQLRFTTPSSVGSLWKSASYCGSRRNRFANAVTGTVRSRYGTASPARKRMQMRCATLARSSNVCKPAWRSLSSATRNRSPWSARPLQPAARFPNASPWQKPTKKRLAGRLCSTRTSPLTTRKSFGIASRGTHPRGVNTRFQRGDCR